MTMRSSCLGAGFLAAVAIMGSRAEAAEPGTSLKIEPPKAVAGSRPEYAKLLAERSNAIITVKAVLQIKAGGGGNDRASEVEVPGLVIDSSGLILCSNMMLGGFAQRMGGGNVSIVPTDIKVLFGNEPEGLDAKLLARDSELDLAWLQIKSLGGRKLEALDLAQSAIPAAGDDLLTLQRMPKQFARVLVITEGRAAGLAQKPRSMVLATGERAPGAPVFSSAGQFIGVSALPGVDDEDRRGAQNVMSRRFSTIVLPASEVMKATARAKEPTDADGG
jgi:hypothetical protein